MGEPSASAASVDPGAAAPSPSLQRSIEQNLPIEAPSKNGEDHVDEPEIEEDHPRPLQLLYKYKTFLKLWGAEAPAIRDVPAGLTNCGNTCFANTTLQCLFSVQPFLRYLLQRKHSETCTAKASDEWCLPCALEGLAASMQKATEPINPREMMRRMHLMGLEPSDEASADGMHFGRQGDAHEFLNRLLTVCIEAAVGARGGSRALELRSQETTLLHHIFGAYALNQLQCQACGFRRKRFQAELGLSLQVTEDSRDLASCLEAYFTDELMAGGNQWACDGCKGKVDCVNSWRLETAPNVLIITLKRFDPATLRKIARVLPFPAQLDLARYKADDSPDDDPAMYALQGVIVHQTNKLRPTTGHYVNYVRSAAGAWHRCNDALVAEVTEADVLGQAAYLLFYVRNAPRSRGPLKPLSDDAKAAMVAKQREAAAAAVPPPPRRNGAVNGDAVPRPVSDAPVAVPATALGSVPRPAATQDRSVPRPAAAPAAAQVGPLRCADAQAAAAAAIAAANGPGADQGRPCAPSSQSHSGAQEARSHAAAPASGPAAVFAWGRDPVPRGAPIVVRSDGVTTGTQNPDFARKRTAESRPADAGTAHGNPLGASVAPAGVWGSSDTRHGGSDGVDAGVEVRQHQMQPPGADQGDPEAACPPLQPPGVWATPIRPVPDGSDHSVADAAPPQDRVAGPPAGAWAAPLSAQPPALRASDAQHASGRGLPPAVPPQQKCSDAGDHTLRSENARGEGAGGGGPPLARPAHGAPPARACSPPRGLRAEQAPPAHDGAADRGPPTGVAPLGRREPQAGSVPHAQKEAVPWRDLVRAQDRGAQRADLRLMRDGSFGVPPRSKGNSGFCKRMERFAAHGFMIDHAEAELLGRSTGSGRSRGREGRISSQDILAKATAQGLVLPAGVSAVPPASPDSPRGASGQHLSHRGGAPALAVVDAPPQEDTPDARGVPFARNGNHSPQAGPAEPPPARRTSERRQHSDAPQLNAAVERPGGQRLHADGTWRDTARDVRRVKVAAGIFDRGGGRVRRNCCLLAAGYVLSAAEQAELGRLSQPEQRIWDRLRSAGYLHDVDRLRSTDGAQGARGSAGNVGAARCSEGAPAGGAPPRSAKTRDGEAQAAARPARGDGALGKGAEAPACNGAPVRAVGKQPPKAEADAHAASANLFGALADEDDSSAPCSGIYSSSGGSASSRSSRDGGETRVGNSSGRSHSAELATGCDGSEAGERTAESPHVLRRRAELRAPPTADVARGDGKENAAAPNGSVSESDSKAAGSEGEGKVAAAALAGSVIEGEAELTEAAGDSRKLVPEEQTAAAAAEAEGTADDGERLEAASEPEGVDNDHCDAPSSVASAPPQPDADAARGGEPALPPAPVWDGVYAAALRPRESPLGQALALRVSLPPGTPAAACRVCVARKSSGHTSHVAVRVRDAEWAAVPLPWAALWEVRRCRVGEGGAALQVDCVVGSGRRRKRA